MLKRLANFIVDKRIFVLTMMLVLTIASMICSNFVTINEDMTKYLPDDSNMKAGMDIMAESFPEMEVSNTIRVMFDDLTDAEKAEILEQITAIEHVDSVDHDPASTEYNKDNHTLYIINMSCGYGSPEEKAIEDALENRFSDYTVTWHNDDTGTPGIPPIILVVVMIILFSILFTMCGSWLDPFLFLITIGFAVVINSGTNIFLGTIASVTDSISSLLQMVLSMDYSIIMMNRYRQERQLEPDKTKAMKNAWANAFSSVSSSSLTTVVGLLMLVFMSFKIGMDLGIVLAKGVFISMVCVLTVLPALTMIFDKPLIKTAKKELHIPMNWAAAFSHKFRYLLTGIFLVMFAVFCFWQGKTGIAYTLVKDDVVAEVFPKSNMLVMVYETQDEENLGDLLTKLEEDDNVTSVMGYGTVLGKPYTSDKLVDAIGEMNDDISLNSAMIDMLYYHYHTGGEVGTMTAGEFLSFIADTVANDDGFSDYIDDDMMDNVDRIGKFADAETLQKPMTAAELAEVFEIDAANIKDLFLLYQIESGTPATGSMTMATFANFIIHDVANDPSYGSMFDAATVSKLRQLSTFTDVNAMTTPYSYKGIASLLGMDAEKTKLLFIYYFALSDSYDPGTMTLPEFVSFLKNDIAADPVFSGYIDEASLAQIDALSAYTDKTQLQTQRDPAALASLLGIDEAMVKTIFILHNAQDVSGKTMTLAQFIQFLNGTLLSNPMFADSFDDATKANLQTMDALIQLAVSNQGLPPAQMAQALGMEESMLKQLYYLYFSTNAEFQQDVATTTMTLSEFLTLLKANSPAEQQAKLAQMEQLIGVAISNAELTAAELAAITGMSEEQAGALIVPPAETMTLAAFLDTATALAPDNAQLQQLKQLVNLAVSGGPLDAATLSGVFGIEQTQVFQLFGLNLAGQKTISLADFTAFLVSDVMGNDAYSANFTPEQKTQLSTMNQLVQLAASGTALDTATLATTFGMDESMTTIVFRLYFGSDITDKTMSLEETIDFILADPVMTGYMDSEAIGQLQMMQKLVKATVNDTKFTPDDLSQLLGMDSSSLKMLFTVRAAESQLNNWALSTQTVVNFLVNNKGTIGAMMDSSQLAGLTTAQAIINGAVSGTAYTADQIAGLTGMSRDQARQLYLLHTSKYGDTSAWKLSIKGFIDFIIDSVLSNKDYADKIDGDMADMVVSAKTMVDAVIANKAYTPGEMADIFRDLTDELDTASIEMMYLYAASLENADPTWTMTMESLFNHLVDKVLEDPRFESFIDEDMRASLLENKTTLEDGKSQLVGEKYSRLIIDTTYLEESDATNAFIQDMETYGENHMDGNIYLIGNSAMVHEMKQIFDKELTFITLLTALAIFLIVALTFRSISIPLILVLLVQCGVYITVTVTGLMSGEIYFLALLIVECILMGATIDYGILFTNYYCEHRRTTDKKEALKKAYHGSIHTIMTSGLILVAITGTVGGMFEDATVSSIVRTISIGSFCAIMLILFVLPGILAACDKLVIKKKNRYEGGN